MTRRSTPRHLGLVLTGGGARAAYQVGFLRFMARELPDLDIPILAGVSAGAINAAHLASHPGNFAEAVSDLTELWHGITPETIFRTDALSLGYSLLCWMAGLLTGGRLGASLHRGFMRTDPLARLLSRSLPNHEGVLVGVRERIESGRLKALGITTTDYGTGQAVTWVQGTGVGGWQRSQRRGREATLTTQHVLASAALPILFPAVRLAGGWHGDGGIRLTAPLSPALHMGAHHVLAISNRYRQTPAEAEVPVIHGYPPAAQIIGTMMNALFLDMLDFDATNMERINALIRQLPEEGRKGLRVVDTSVLRPSCDLGRLAAGFEARLPYALRFFTRGFGTRETEAPDSLSLLMFQHDYIERLMQLGEEDARAHGAELMDFVRAAD